MEDKCANKSFKCDECAHHAQEYPCEECVHNGGEYNMYFPADEMNEILGTSKQPKIKDAKTEESHD